MASNMIMSHELIKQSKYSHLVYKVIICVIMAAAFLLRFKGVWFGYPLMVHPDEHHIVDSALNMIKSHNPHPHMFFYPSLNIYLQAVTYYALNMYHSIIGYSVGDPAIARVAMDRHGPGAVRIFSIVLRADSDRVWIFCSVVCFLHTGLGVEFAYQ